MELKEVPRMIARIIMKTHLQRMKNTRLAYLKEINKTGYQKKHMHS